EHTASAVQLHVLWLGQLSGFELAAPAIYGEMETTATLHMSLPVPPEGINIRVTSSNDALATVPPTVHLEADAVAATFMLTPFGVAMDSEVTITVTYREVTKSAVLQIRAPRLASLDLIPNPVSGASSVRGIVVLGSTAVIATDVALTTTCQA